MGLIDLKTDLKSLRYGKDRIGGGSSNQPYIKSEIPSKEGDLDSTGGPDFLLRGGLLTPGRALKDVSRMTQMFFDFKSPNGLLFTAKQNVLSLTNVNSNKGYEKYTPVSTNTTGRTAIGRFISQAGDFIENNIAINQGIYTPLSTIGQSAGNALGIHLNKQGLNPLAGTSSTTGISIGSSITGFDPLGLPTYLNTTKGDGDEGRKSRFYNFVNKINKKSTDTVLYKYTGGPGATLGVGTTTIPLPLPKDRTGKNNPEVEKFKFANIDWFNLKYTEGNQTEIQKSNLLKDPIIRFEITNDKDKRVGASLKYVSEFTNTFRPITSLFQFDGKAKLPPSVYKKGPNEYTLKTNTEIAGGNTLTQEQLVEKKSAAKTGIYNTENFITNIPGALPYLKTNYSGSNRIEQRVNLGNPGKKTKDDTVALDKINARLIYKTDANNPIVTETNDLVKFRIGVIDNNNPKFKTNIHFRAFIDSMSDTYSADWQTQKFMGRGENFYRYNGFDRTVSLSWTVAAQSKAELMPMYQKLNYLASVCAPDYSDLGYMRGNLIKLTIGGYLYEQVGIMKSITYDIPQESPWEIALPYGTAQTTDGLGVKSDSSVKEMPHMIKVTGFQFIPIHDFVPSVQKNSFIGYDGGNSNQEGGSFPIEKYGDQKYIALSNGLNPDNYKVKNG